ncbi:unnamed protein product [Spirodela intermedia]|uniref:HMA domain-containing protein n=2 Tax=Spirodela intermedia TaxID=51605 RepID=A0A7I8KID6_SPIIN|nr:unnamed protein product [Spirodela intermedia]CAA6660844.1 unnamed protein product [Spirodela intermedia]CAA7397202.1 unnamed protein product [Spirodela intermedia]
MGGTDLLNRFLGCLSLSVCCNSRRCSSSPDGKDPCERKALTASEQTFEGTRTLAYHLQPKTIVLRVSMHCNACATKVRKHISKMEGVAWFEVDLESKKVVVVGDITPFEVLESISKVKFAEFWTA